MTLNHTNKKTSLLSSLKPIKIQEKKIIMWCPPPPNKNDVKIVLNDVIILSNASMDVNKSPLKIWFKKRKLTPTQFLDLGIALSLEPFSLPPPNILN